MASAVRKRSVKWLSRLPGAVMVGAVVIFAWPMLKGWAYTFFPPEPPTAEELPQWRPDFETAMREAEASGNPVLIDFMAPWCPPCRVMEADVWPDPKVRAALEGRVVPLQVDLDDPAMSGLAKTYEVQSIPTILLVTSEGEVIDRSGYMGSRSLIRFVKSAPLPERGQASEKI